MVYKSDCSGESGIFIGQVKQEVNALSTPRGYAQMLTLVQAHLSKSFY